MTATPVQTSMRIILLGTLATLVMTGLGFWVRPREKAASNVLFFFAAVLAAYLIAAFYQWV